MLYSNFYKQASKRKSDHILTNVGVETRAIIMRKNIMIRAYIYSSHNNNYGKRDIL